MSPIKLALIPPTSLLSATTKTNYQLMLPQELHNEHYRNWYKKLCNDIRQYVILDNGAAEGELASPDVMFKICEAFGPDEMVLPDVLGNGPGTVRVVREFLCDYDIGSTKLGLVAAGANKKEALKTVKVVMRSAGDQIDVIYIPRMLVIPEEPLVRINMAAELMDEYNKPIHFLGTNPLFVEEVVRAAASGMVRGVDTSAPFNYTYWTSLLTSGMRCNRPRNYFELGAGNFDKFMLEANIKTILEWSHGNFA